MATRRRKKSSYARYFVVASMVAAGCFLFYLAYLWWDTREPEFVTYPEFDIPIPSGYAIHGIDVSRYQQRISWKSVQKMQVRDVRLHFAFIKATEGTSLTDPQFRRNWREAAEAGLVRGAYHFFVPWKKGKPQAEHFIKKVKLKTGDLPPVLDIETIGRITPSLLRQELRAWLAAMEAAYGVKPIIYTNAYFYQRYLEGYFEEYPLWVAHYLQPNKPRIERAWSFWQHSEKGRVNGITSRVDFNVFNGDSAAFRALLVP